MRKNNLFIFIVICFIALQYLTYVATTTNHKENPSLGIDTSSVNSVKFNDTIKIHDTIFVEKTDTVYITKFDTCKVYCMVPEIDYLDSVQTEEQKNSILANGRFEIESKNRIMPTLYSGDDIELLPYLLYIYSNEELLPIEQYQYTQNFIDLCVSKTDDKNLFLLGKNIIERLRTITRGHNIYIIDYPSSFKKSREYSNVSNHSKSTELNIDSLIIQTVAYNNRSALGELEKYYSKTNPKGIAIYYKVLLGYEGNSDLAERFYKVLEPYFEETPQFRMATREVLLRAALCDHNERAQELCDSLGFSLCDYKLPLP